MKIEKMLAGSNRLNLEHTFRVTANKFKAYFTVRDMDIPFVESALAISHSKRTVRKIAKHFGLRFP